jgi:hypothetical protein
MAGIQRVKYRTNSNNIFNVLLDNNTGIDSLIGSPPTEDYTENMTIKVSKNRKQVGIKPREVLLTRSIGDEGTYTNCLIQGADRYKRVPIPTKERWDAITLQSTFTIGGTTYKVRKKLQEEIA